MIDIRLENVCWSYGADLIFHNVNLSQKLGGIVAICGPHRSGKATLMRLLSASILTKSGTVFVPSHLRTLYIQQELVFLDRSAWENLTFGFPGAAPKIVKDVLLGLGLHDIWTIVLQDLDELGCPYTQQDDDDYLGSASPVQRRKTTMHPPMPGVGRTNKAGWLSSLTHGEKAKVNLARALIMNPEVLLLQRPLCHFDNEQFNEVLNILVQHVDQRGYKMPRETSIYRRPRTLFFNPIFKSELEIANTYWYINSAERNVDVVPKSDLASISLLGDRNVQRIWSQITATVQ
mmetsp:Transcript_106131/g.274504  ORF Transcript_106131/g.274504 Transcript_106131/m.274504 type:complete len:290 (+) Transcript_106131:3-872(+)